MVSYEFERFRGVVDLQQVGKREKIVALFGFVFALVGRGLGERDGEVDKLLLLADRLGGAVKALVGLGLLLEQEKVVGRLCDCSGRPGSGYARPGRRWPRWRW